MPRDPKIEPCNIFKQFSKIKRGNPNCVPPEGYEMAYQRNSNIKRARWREKYKEKLL